MQCHLNGVHISEVHKFLSESACVTTYAIELIDSFDAAHPLIILLQLSSVTSYFDVYSPSIAEYENKDIPKIHLTAEEPPWGPSRKEYSESENRMLDHQGQISISVTVERRPEYVSAIVSYSLAYEAPDVMDNVNLVTSLSAQIQVSIVLIGMVRPIVLTK